MLAVLLLLVTTSVVSAWLVELLNMKLAPDNANRFDQIILFCLLVYIVLISLPFVPGIEMGLALLVMAGPGSAILVYASTVLGLSLGFLLGYLLPIGWLKSLSDYLFLSRLSGLIERMEPLHRKQRLALLLANAPSAIIPFLLRHRYIAVAVALNIPGNAVMGGGGGISMLAGLSRLFSPLTYLLMLALAVAPVPIAVLMFGKGVLSP